MANIWIRSYEHISIRKSNSHLMVMEGSIAGMSRHDMNAQQKDDSLNDLSVPRSSRGDMRKEGGSVRGRAVVLFSNLALNSTASPTPHHKPMGILSER